MSEEVEAREEPTNTRSKRGLFHGRQRLLWSLALAGAAVVWIAILTYNARRQAGAVIAIRALGGKVSYGDELPLARPWWGQQRLGQWMGRDYVWPAVLVKLGGTGLRDSDLTCLEPLSGLLEVHITDAPAVTDAGLRYLRNKASLEKVSLRGTHFGDDGLAYLDGLKGLKFLDLQATDVTDAGLEHVKHLPQLKGVNLMETRVRAEAAQRLRDDGHEAFVKR